MLSVHQFQKSFRLHKYPIALIALSSIAFLSGLWRNGYAYTYYSAAAQAGSQSWKAFFFGSIDAANFMSIDKPPFAVWFSSLSVRVFGLSPFSVLLPHALAGVGCCLVLYATMRRVCDKRTSFLAGILFIIAPASVVVFRYNVTDSFLMLFILISVYCYLRSLEDSSMRWLICSAFATGCAFNTKMTQGLIVVPIFVVMYLYNAQNNFLKKCFHVAAYSVVVLVSSLWWAVIVSLVDESRRPWIGSTTNNSIWELIFVHNGFGRLFASNWKQPTGNSDLGVAFGGEPGPFRMFNSGFGPNFVWFFGIAIAGTFLAIWSYRSSKNHVMIKNHIGVWFFSIFLFGAVFSFTQGTIHPYYAISFVPGVAALAAFALSTFFSSEVKNEDRSRSYHIIANASFLTTFVFVLLYFHNASGWSLAVMVVAIILTGVASYTYWMAIVLKKLTLLRYVTFVGVSALVVISVSLTIADMFYIQRGFMPTTHPLPDIYSKIEKPDQSIPAAFSEYLLNNYNGEKWIAASPSAIQSAPIQLTTRKPVIALGGFSANDNPMSLKEFQKLVKSGDVKYFVMNKKQVQAFQQCTPKIVVSEGKTKLDTSCSASAANNAKSSAAIEKWVKTRTHIDNKDFGHWDVYDLDTPQN